MKSFTPKQKNIITSAVEIISEKSIQGLTIKNLSRKLGVTEGALYRHFDSKFDILLSILTVFQNNAREILETTSAPNQPAIDQIKTLFKHHFQYFAETPAVTAVIFSESIFQNNSRLSHEVSNLLKMHEKALWNIVRNGQKNGELRQDIPCKQIVRLIIGANRYTVTKWRLSNFKFNLLKEGDILLNSIKLMIRA